MPTEISSTRAGGLGAALMLSLTPAAVLVVVSFVSNLLMLTGPIFMLQVYDRVLISRSMPTLVALTLLVTVLYAFYAGLEWIRSRMSVRFAGLVDEHLTRPAFEVSVRQRLVHQADGASDPVRDLDAIRQFVGGHGPLSLLDLPWVPVYLAIVFTLHPLLGWIATIGAIVIVGLLVVNEAFSRRPVRDANVAINRRMSFGEDARTNVESLVAMGMMESIVGRWLERAREVRGAQRLAADRLAFYGSLTKGFRFLLQSIVLAAGAYLIILGEATGGVMIAASIITSRALAPVEQTVAQWRGFVAARQAAKRLGAALRLNRRTARQTTLPAPSRSLRVSQLITSPERTVRPIVTGVTFTLEAGEGLGVLGRSGSGKSSLARALVGVWPVLGGEVRLDGSQIEHFKPELLGRSVGYLPQMVELFDGTVAENIARFRADRTDEAVLAAAAAAGVHELIAGLPNGYDTRIGERGSVLSAGQRQRIGLARALFGDPFLLVLDEPNSNLDTEGDEALTQALVQARERGAIVVVVAHRPSAIAAVDKLLYLAGGRQTALGPKEEVLRQMAAQAAPPPSPPAGPTLIDTARLSMGARWHG